MLLLDAWVRFFCYAKGIAPAIAAKIIGSARVRSCLARTKGSLFDGGKTYMLRVFGGRAHEMWDGGELEARHEYTSYH